MAFVGIDLRPLRDEIDIEDRRQKRPGQGRRRYSIRHEKGLSQEAFCFRRGVSELRRLKPICGRLRRRGLAP